MTEGFSFEEAKQSAEPQGFSFNEAKQSAEPQGFSFDEAKTPAPKVEKTRVAPTTPEESENSITDFLGRVVKNVPESMNIGAAGAFRALSEQESDVYQKTPQGRLYQALTGTIGEKDPAALTAEFMAKQASESEARKIKPPADQGLILSGVESGLESFGQNLALLPAAMLPGGQAAVLTAFGGMTGGQAYQEAREKGLRPEQALPFAASQGVIEVATEKMPLGSLLNDINQKTGFGRMLLNQLKKEIPGEQLATILQDLNEWAILNPEKPFSSYLADRPSAAAQTFIATVVGTGGNVIVGKAMQKGAVAISQTQEQREKDETADKHIEEIEKGIKNPEDYTAEEVAEIERRQQEVAAIEESITKAQSPIIAELENDIRKSYGEDAQQIFDLADERLYKGIATDRVSALAEATRIVAQYSKEDGLPEETEETEEVDTAEQERLREDRLIDSAMKVSGADFGKLVGGVLFDEVKNIVGRNPTIDELRGVYDDYAGSTNPSIDDVIERFESRISAPSGRSVGEGVATQPTQVGQAGVGVPSALTGGAGVGAEGQPSALTKAQPVVNQALRNLVETEGEPTRSSKDLEELEGLYNQGLTLYGFKGYDETVPPFEITDPEQLSDDEFSYFLYLTPQQLEALDEREAANEEAADEARQTQAEQDVDSGPIGQAIDKLDEGNFETKSQVKRFAKKLEKDGIIEDTSDIDELVSDRSEDVDSVISKLQELLDDARDTAIDERKEELDLEASDRDVFRSVDPTKNERIAFVESVASAIDPVEDFKQRMAILGIGSLINYKAAINRLEKAYRSGKISAQTFVDEALEIIDKQNAASEKRRARNFNDQNLKRGADEAIRKIISAKIKGQITPESADFAIWFITNNPHAANDLALSIRLPTKARSFEGASGYYRSVNKLATILLDRSPYDVTRTDAFPRKRKDKTSYAPNKFDTIVHEILHHMERMMPPEMQDEIAKLWKRSVRRAMKRAIEENDTAVIDYLIDVMLGSNGAMEGYKSALKAINDGLVDPSFYALYSPSEFWAVNAAGILTDRFDASTKFQKIKQWVREFVETVKKVFGLDNTAPVIKALNNVLKGDGTFLSKSMLVDLPIIFSIDPETAAEKIVNESLRANQLNPVVVRAIQNDDISGALRGIAQNTSGFFRELATALANLNLPTNIGFNRSRELIRRTLDEFGSSNQNRLFGYIQVKYPDIYNKYFQNYDQADSLEKVYEGLQVLEKRNIDLGPVIADYETVKDLYDSNIFALTRPGAYFPALDAITLNTDIDEAGGTYRVALHEVAHAATMYMLLADPNTLTEGQRATVAELKKLYEYAQTKLSPGEYGFTNIYEFVAEVLTNKSFQNKLKEIPYTPRKVPLFTQLVRSIMKMFGIENLAGASMVEATQLFSAVRSVSVKAIPPMFAQGKKRYRGPITTPDSWRTGASFVTRRVARLNKSLLGHPTWQKVSGPLKKQLWSIRNTQGRSLWLPNLYLSHLAELTKNKFPQIQGAINTIRSMVTLRNKYLTEAEEIVKGWSRLQSKFPKMSKLMSLIMLDSTINSVDPDPTSAGYDPAKVPQKLQDAWNSLPPEFQQLYRDVREHYKKMLNETIQEMKDRINNRSISAAEKQKLLADLNRRIGPDKIVAPYFPLRRFGDHWFQVGPATGVPGQFKEFYTFESVADRDEAIELRKAEIQANPRLSADQKQNLLSTFAAGNSFSELLSQNIASTAALKEVQELIDNVSATDVAAAKDQMKDAVDQLIYVLLPQQSVRKMFINRQAIQGASEDMLRVFATTSVHGAYQLSRFKYAEQFTQNIQNAQTYVRDKYKGEENVQLMAMYNDYIKELENRGPQIMSNEDRNTFAVNMSNRATEMTFFFMLSAPASALVNVIGMAQFGLSELGGRYDYSKAATRLTLNLLKYGATTGKRSIKPLLKGQILQVEFPSVMEAGNLSPVQKQAAKRFIEENDVNISQVSDMMSIGDAPSALYTGRYNMIKRAMAAIFHQAERLNREVLLLTAFDLAYEKYTGAEKRTEAGYVSRVQQRDAKGNLVYKTVTNPKTGQTTQEPVMVAETFSQQEAFEKAIEEAREVVSASLGDSTRQMKPRTLATPILKVLMQFKAYAITATTFLIHNFTQGIGGNLSTKEKQLIRNQISKDLGIVPITSQMTQAQVDAVNQAKAIEAYQKDLRTLGRKKLAGTLGVTFLLGGTNSIIGPTVGFLSGLGVLVRSMLSLDDDEDDDEFFDFDNWFNNYCAETLGGYSAEMLMEAGVSEETARRVGKNLGMSVARGPVGTATGVSLSDRVSIDPLGLWIRDSKFSPDLKTEVIDTAIANAGPAVGLGVNFLDAWKLMQQGQYQRAFEKAAPAMFAKPVTAERIASEGAKTAAGVELIDKEAFSSWDIAMQALGFQPEKLAIKQKASIEMKTREQKVLAKRDALLDRLWLEYYIMESSSGYDKAMSKIDKFNDKYPSVAIKPATIRESFDNRRKAINDAEAIGGAKIQKKLRGDIEPYGRYAQ